MSGRGFKLLRDFEAHASEVRCLSIGRKSGLVFATGSEDRKVNLWSLTKANCLMSLTGHTSSVECVTFDSSEEVLAAGSSGGTVKLWDLDTQKVVRTLSGHKSNVTAIDFHPFGEYLASASYDTTVKLWDIKSRSCINTYRGDNDPVTFIRFTPDGRWIVAGSETGHLTVWDLSTAKALHTFTDHTAAVRWFEFHPHECLLATGSDDRTVKFYDLETFELVSGTETDITRVHTVTFSPDGRCLMAGYHDGLKVLGWEPPAILDCVSCNWGTRLLDAAFVRDQFVAASCQGTHVSLWVVPTQKLRMGGDVPVEDPMGETMRRLQDTHRPVSRAKRSVEGDVSPSPDAGGEGGDSAAAAPTSLEVCGAPVLPPQAAPWVRCSGLNRTGTAGGVIHVHTPDAIQSTSPRGQSPPGPGLLASVPAAAGPLPPLAQAPQPVVQSAPPSAPSRPQLQPVQSAPKQQPPGSRRSGQLVPPLAPPPQTAPAGAPPRERPEVDIRAMAVAQQQRAADTPADVEAEREIIGAHDDMVSLMSARLHNMRTVRALWAVNPKNALEELEKINDTAIAADLIGIMMRKPELFTLERAVILLPFVERLLQGPYDEMLSLGLNSMMLFASSFGPLIKASLETPPPAGIDFSREERTERCKVLAASFKKTQPRLTALCRRKAVAEVARQLSAKLRELGLD